MKYLVTGGAGFIGSNLVDKLIEQRHDVVVVDNLSTGKKENINPSAKFVEADITDKGFTEIVKEEKPNGIFHLAAIPRVPVSVEDPVGTTNTNVTGTVIVFKAAADAGVSRVVFASSSSVYGDQEKMPLKEDISPNPISPYALHKLAGEYFAKQCGVLYNLPVICLRYFNVYGPRIDFKSNYSLVLGSFMRYKKDDKPLTIYGDGEQTRGFTYVDDVVTANIKAMETQKLKGGEVINIGAEKSNSINELADMVGGEKEYSPPREGDVRHTAADITKARQLLNWEPKTTLKEGVQKTIEWFKNYEK